jgi:hypothetical protein
VGYAPQMRLALGVAAVLVGLCLCAPAGAAPGIRYGVQDDAWLTHGPGTLDERLDELDRLGVDLVRFNLRWDAIERTRGAPDWTASDEVLGGLRDHGIAAVVGIVGTPRWANGGRPPNYAPRRAADVAAFARATAKRYRWVRDWLVWNEPNQRRWLRPTSPALYVARILNPAYAAIHSVNRRARVAGGVTAPRANLGGVSPVDWIRGMRRAGARLDVYAHNPHPARPSDSPFPVEGGCARCSTITMSTLERLLSEVKRAWGAGKRIWLTEYAYQTNPPDRIAGVSQARQARLLADASLRAYRAPRVDMLVHYLVRDEPTLDRWQSGLYTFAGRPKLAAHAYPLPLTVAGRSGGGIVIWGMVRPRTGRQDYRVQVRKRGSGWAWLGPQRRTSPHGFLSVRVRLPRGTLVRVWSPADDAYSLPVAV